MAATLQLDRIDGNELVQDGQIWRFTRTGVIKDIDVTPGSEMEFLWDCQNNNVVAGMPQNADPCPGHPLLRLTQRRFVPMSHDSARVFLVYETPQGFPTTSYLLRDETTLTEVETQFIPGTRKQIFIPGYSTDTTTFVGDAVTMRFRLPIRSLSVSLVGIGSVQQSNNYVGYCNDGSWQGKAKGYWLMDQFRTMQSKYQGFFSLEAVAVTKSYEDWSQTGALFNKLVGKYFEVDQAVIDATNALPYAYGEIANKSASDPDAWVPPKFSGYIRIGPYPMANFTSIFGF
jgi:hypothetical protein